MFQIIIISIFFGHVLLSAPEILVTATYRGQNGGSLHVKEIRKKAVFFPDERTCIRRNVVGLQVTALERELRGCILLSFLPF